MAEEARLESVYTSKAYPGFESRSLRSPLFLIELELQFPDENGMFPVLVNGNGIAVEVVDIFQLLKVAVGVSVEHKVQSASLANHAVTGELGGLPTQVA